MEITEFDYELDPNLIAQEPSQRREESRLLVVDRQTQTWQHYDHFSNIAQFLHPGDVLVLNNTKVLYARLVGHRTSGGKVEALILRSQDNSAEALIQTTHVPKINEPYFFGPHTATVQKRGEEGWILQFTNATVVQVMQEIGLPPLPPYIKRKHSKESTTLTDQHTAQDRERYQTVYAQIPGSVAAPTAGFHFTKTLLEQLKQSGIEIVEVTLHVGTGTFLPIKVAQIEQHKMHYESYNISEQVADTINTALQQGRRIIATGTTSCRTLESAGQTGRIQPGSGQTNLFIYPGYTYRIVRALITNFHLPKSTLLLLVSAFAGTQLIRQAYQSAIACRYRFYSYGDAMFIH